MDNLAVSLIKPKEHGELSNYKLNENSSGDDRELNDLITDSNSNSDSSSFCSHGLYISFNKLEKCDNFLISSNDFDRTFLDDYTIISKINTGSSGFVLCAKPKRDDLVSIHGKSICKSDYVAVKVIYKNRIPFQNWLIHNHSVLLPSEISILIDLDNPKIAMLLSYYEDKTFFYLVFEHGSGNSVAPSVENEFSLNQPHLVAEPPPVDLREYLNSIYPQYLPESEIAFIFSQLVTAVKYLHERSIIHSDIKTENVAIDANTKLIKLIDFGCAVKLNDNSTDKILDGFTGTLTCAAPQVSYNSPYICGPHLDLWSLGVVLFFLSFNSYPFSSPSDRSISGSWINIASKTRIKRSTGLLFLISTLLQVNPSSRSTASSIATHPWLINNNHSSIPFD